MKLPFSLFLALRYLKPKRTFVSIITLISVLGVTLGIGVLILVIAVMSGFELELQKKILGFEPHLTVLDDAPLDDWQDIAAKVKSVPGVREVAPFVQGPVLVKFLDRVYPPKIRGIDPTQERKMIEIEKFIVAGKFDLDGDKCVVGSDLASLLGLGVGDMLQIYSPNNTKSVMKALDEKKASGKDSASLDEIKQLILPTELEVTGIFKSGRYDYDSEFLLVPLHIGQELYELDGAVHGIAVKTDEPFSIEQTKRAVIDRIGPPHLVLTWMDMNKPFFDAIRVERGMMFFILMIIVVVAAFCIMNTLFTFTFLKTREIGVLKALGAQTAQVVQVFVFQGMMIGLLGSATGLAFAMFVLRFRNEARDLLADVLHIEVFPASVYQFSEIPAKIVPGDVAIICLSGFAICSVAALIPAFFAARLDPVKALRYE